MSWLQAQWNHHHFGGHLDWLWDEVSTAAKWAAWRDSVGLADHVCLDRLWRSIKCQSLLPYSLCLLVPAIPQAHVCGHRGRGRMNQKTFVSVIHNFFVIFFYRFWYVRGVNPLGQLFTCLQGDQALFFCCRKCLQAEMPFLKPGIHTTPTSCVKSILNPWAPLFSFSQSGNNSNFSTFIPRKGWTHGEIH